MPSLSNESKNEKSLTNASFSRSPKLKEIPVSLKDVVRPLKAPGWPIINESKNNKTLTNETENT